MTNYVPPLREIEFALTELAGLDHVTALPGFEEATSDLTDSILAEAAKIAEEIIAPLNKVGDVQGSKLVDGTVVTPPGWDNAWNALVEGGWNGLPFSPDHGGMGLPNLLNTAVQEMWQTANMAFALCPMLTQGAVHAIDMYGSEQQKAMYLPRMISGEWTGTMNLTEPQAGSDLAAIRTRAVPEGDHFRIYGQKIFITYGDHELTPNIIHLVLGRTPDAPPGIKGISLFVCPKFLTDEQGNIGERNDVSCVSLEHKLGIHGSPTAVLSFGDSKGAIGWLIGEENRGLEYMFTMMNHARLSVGMQGLAIAERAYQLARSYARDRAQGKPVGWTGPLPTGIVHHPEVRRQLMGMKSRIEAMRGILYTAAAAIDVAHCHADQIERAKAHQMVELLTPIAKGWCTETGQEIASVGVQVHGGMGYIEETGACQHLRDARITTIYEGTTAIQANDLMYRKLLRDGGKGISSLLAEITDLGKVLAQSSDANLPAVGQSLVDACAVAAQTAAWIVSMADGDVRIPAAAATPFLELMGTLAGGWQLAKAAQIAVTKISNGTADDGFLSSKPITARYYAEHYLTRISSLQQAIQRGSALVMALDDEVL